MDNTNDLSIINLYVERIEKKNKTILLDFIFEEDYTHTIDTLRDRFELDIETVSQHFVKPSMIMVNNFSSSRSLYEGAILAIYRYRFIQMILEYATIQRNINDSTEPSQILLTIENGNQFAKTIEENEIKSVNYNNSFYDTSCIAMFDRFSDSNNREYNVFFDSEKRFLSSFDETDSSMIVWNVEQGNANGIYNDTSVVLFDFGAPIFATAKRTLQLYTTIISSLQNKSYALIISHWDLDHYKMLCQAPDDFFKEIEFIMFPTRAVSYTSKQVLQRFSKLCKNKCIPVLPISPKFGSFGLVDWIGPFHIYTGNSKMNINNSGLFLGVTGYKSYGLFTGDRTNWNSNCMLYLYCPGNNQKMNIVVPHHGGNSKNIPDRHSITNPNIAAISVGNNPYSHPTLKTINQYKSRGYRVVRTDSYGDIVIPLGNLI